MNIHKLKYENRELAISDLISKGIIYEDLLFEYPTHAVVELGEGLFDIMVEPPIVVQPVYDDEMNLLSEAVYKEYCFGENEIHPITPNHTFGGWQLDIDDTVDIIVE